MTQHKIIGIDLAKNIFFLVEINHKGKNLSRKKLQRSRLLNYVANQSPCIIAMEACSGAHYWAREFEKLGHEVLLYPPQHVKNQRRKQKNDYNDAEAIAELALYQRVYPVLHISGHSDQSFRDYPITHFGFNRSLIPRLSDHF